MHPAAKFILKFYAFLALLITLFFLAGCSPDPAPEQPLELRWSDSYRPVSVLVQDTDRLECLDAATGGVQFWQEKGVRYIFAEVVEPNHPAVAGFPGRSEIAISFGKLNGGTTGTTWNERTIGGQLISAHIVIARCHPQTVAHELGHAMGLNHVNDSNSLMYPAVCTGGCTVENAWEVSEEELGWVL